MDNNNINYFTVTFSMDSKTMEMLDWLCDQDQNNRSQKARALIRKEYKARHHDTAASAGDDKKDVDVLNGSQVGI